MLGPLLLISLGFPLQPQEPIIPPPLEAGVIAMVGEKSFSKDEYFTALYRQFGKRGVEEMVTDWLIEVEAEKYGIQISPQAETEAFLQREERERRGQTLEVFTNTLKGRGKDLALYQESLRHQIRQDLLLKELIRKTRIATDDKTWAAFENLYGLDGIKVEVRHILTMPNVLRASLIKQGKKPTEINRDELMEQAREMAHAIYSRLLAGEIFADLAKELSHDRVSKDSGGALPHYKGRLYGPAFRSAVEDLGVGEASGVIQSGAGFHIVQLINRTTTAFQTVHADLVQVVLTAEPTLQEMTHYRQGIFQNSKAQLW